MKWKFESSDKVINIDSKFSRFSGKLNFDRHLIVPSYIVNEWEKMMDFPSLIQSCELVLDLKGMMLPPNRWVKIVELSK